MAGSSPSLRRAQKQGKCEDQGSFLSHGVRKVLWITHIFCWLEWDSSPLQSGLSPRAPAKGHLQTQYLPFLLCLLQEKGAGRTWAATHALIAPFTCIQQLLLQESSLHCPASSSRHCRGPAPALPLLTVHLGTGGARACRALSADQDVQHNGFCGDSEHMSSVAPKIVFTQRHCRNQHPSGEKSLVWKDTCSKPGMPHKHALRYSLISI